MSQPKTTVAAPQASQVSQQLSLLQTRVRDMTTQLDITIKTLVQDNIALKKQIADLTANQQTSTQQTASQQASTQRTSKS